MNTCKDLLFRFKMKKFFDEEFEISKKSFILIHSFKSNTSYNLIGVFFDIWFFFKKKTYLTFDFYFTIWLTFVIFFIFIFLPFCYLIFFFFHLLTLWLKWLYAIIMNSESETILDLSSPSFFNNSSFKFILFGYFELPKIYVFLTNYIFLGRKVNKFSTAVFYNFLSTYLTHFPLWFFNFIISFTIFLYEILKSGIWRRKKKKIWLKIFFNYCENFFHKRLWDTWFTLCAQFDKAKISVSRRGVFLNPHHGEQIATLLSQCSNLRKPSTMLAANVGEIRHSTEYDYTTRIGLVYTSRKYVDVNEEKLPTFQISANTRNQFGIFSVIDSSALETYDWKNHIKFLAKIKASSFNHIIGSSLRNKILSNRYPLVQLNQWVEKDLNGREICQKSFIAVEQASPFSIEDNKFIDDVIFNMNDCDIFHSLLKYKPTLFSDLYRTHLNFYHSIWKE